MGNYVFADEYVGGVAIYDSSHAGGPVFQTTLYGGGGAWSDIYDMLFQLPYVYGAASTDLGETLNIYDTSASPASRVGQYFDPSQEAFSVQSSGHYLYVGGSSNTTVLDVTQPWNSRYRPHIGIMSDWMDADEGLGSTVVLESSAPSGPSPYSACGPWDDPWR